MASDDPGLWSASEQAAAVASGELSSRELTAHVIDRIERLDGDINAVVTRDFEGALERAAAADAAQAGGATLGPLHGVPFTAKDALMTAGIRSTGGARELTDNVPDTDAAVVAACRAAGAIVIGKTNLPRWSADNQSFNDLFGTTNNPWDLTKVPGGSSGGAAAATAMGFTGFEIGTDIGGSIRFPASYNGIWGHKPSFGVIPTTGYLDHLRGGTTEPDINVFGPLTRSCDDLELLFDVLLRTEEPWVPQLPPAPDDVGGLRVAAWLDDEYCPVDGDVLEVMNAAVGALEASGVRVDHAARPDIDPLPAWETGLWLVRAAMTLAGRGEGPGHREWLERHMAREECRRKWADFFTGYDAILMPVSFHPPFDHMQEGTFAERRIPANGIERPYIEMTRWTILTGMSYLPATVPPLGLTTQGLPVGFQVVGPYGGDRTTMALARRIGELTGGYQPPPRAL